MLIVDDDPDMLDLVEQAIVDRGYRAARANNGEEALARTAEAEPQLILLDMRMPVMDGWSFARVFRERYGRLIPIIVMTAAEDSKLRADEVGAEADLGKPFELERLYEVVADTVGPP
ncbi:MAG TPA: response regulator [Kofleriaceae bacterium]|nr:response regulator [Kofleriaceae bacterium]